MLTRLVLTLGILITPVLTTYASTEAQEIALEQESELSMKELEDLVINEEGGADAASATQDGATSEHNPNIDTNNFKQIDQDRYDAIAQAKNDHDNANEPKFDLTQEIANLKKEKDLFIKTQAIFLEVANKNPKSQYTDPVIIVARNDNNEARLAVAKTELKIAIINQDNIAMVKAQNRIADIEEASRLSSLKIAEAQKQAIKDRVAKKRSSEVETMPQIAPTPTTVPMPTAAPSEAPSINSTPQPSAEPNAGGKVNGPTSVPTESKIGPSIGKIKHHHKINKINEEQLPPSLIFPMSSRALDE